MEARLTVAEDLGREACNKLLDDVEPVLGALQQQAQDLDAAVQELRARMVEVEAATGLGPGIPSSFNAVPLSPTAAGRKEERSTTPTKSSSPAPVGRWQAGHGGKPGAATPSPKGTQQRSPSGSGRKGVSPSGSYAARAAAMAVLSGGSGPEVRCPAF